MSKKFLIKYLTIIVLLIFLFINNSFYVLAQTTPTWIPVPTPTYALFQDQGNDFNYLNQYDEWIQKQFLESELNCGNIGQACCGRAYSPQIKLIDNFLSSIIFFLPGSYGLRSLISLLFPIAVSIISPIIDTATNLPNRILGFIEVETRGYCAHGYPSNEFNIDQCTCVSSDNLAAGRLCGVLTNNSEKNKCFNTCMKDGSGVWTALGCFSSDLSTMIKEKVFGLGVGLAGFIALMCIIYSAFQLQTSQGSTEKIKKVQELLTSCIMGLMLIIFSVFILRLIGVDILKIPGFGK
ncbi:MAG: hypothetical protein N2482_01655 [Patescibacteria group bacterium]|nr:hypothetical protein [Patescibacteria group bacterium]